MSPRPWLSLLTLGLAACTGEALLEPTRTGPEATPVPARVAARPAPAPAPTLGPRRTLQLSAGATRLYLSQLAPYLVQRELTPAELDEVDARGGAAIEPILRAWLADPGFAEAARLLIQNKLSVSGTRDGVDYELPGNLAAYVVRHDLPFSFVLTADHCVSAQGTRIHCDSGAPYTAGVLTTRAYLKSRASRFNLTRADTMLKVFACRGYPMEDQLQPRLDRSTLIPMFQALTQSEQQDPQAANGFGNGTACYTCHGQFGAHAQLFVRFDVNGVYRPTATGLQDPAGELGRSTNGLLASHLKDPAQARLEVSQMFGRPVQHLADAARVLAQSPAFAQCQVRNLLEFALGLDDADPVEEQAIREIADRATALMTHDPTLAELALETFADPRVIRAVVEGAGGAL